MSKVLVLYYSAYGHIEKTAEAVAEGARAVPGTEDAIKRVPELVPEEIAKKSGMKLDQPAPDCDSGRAREVTTPIPSLERPRASATCACRCASRPTMIMP